MELVRLEPLTLGFLKSPLPRYFDLVALSLNSFFERKEESLRSKANLVKIERGYSKVFFTGSLVPRPSPGSDPWVRVLSLPLYLGIELL